MRPNDSIRRHIRVWMTLKRHRVRKAHTVIREARRAGLPLPDALAMLELETGIPQRNIFGCDHGEGRAFCREKVTRRRVRRLLNGPYSNGIGWTQITFKPLIPAELEGRLHRPKYQMRVGFGFLAELIREHGRRTGHSRYNGSTPLANAYGARAVTLARAWATAIASESGGQRAERLEDDVVVGLGRDLREDLRDPAL